MVIISYIMPAETVFGPDASQADSMKKRLKKTPSLVDELGISSYSKKATSAAADKTKGALHAAVVTDQVDVSSSSSLKKRNGKKKAGKGGNDIDQSLDTIVASVSAASATTARASGAMFSINPPSSVAAPGKTSTSSSFKTSPSSDSSGPVAQGNSHGDLLHPPSPRRIASHSTISISTLSDGNSSGRSSGNDTSTARGGNTGTSDEGWQVVTKRNAAKSNTASKNSSFTSLNSLASTTTVMTKKQRENAKKYAKEKEKKERERQIQAERLNAHRLEQERAATSAPAKKGLLLL